MKRILIKILASYIILILIYIVHSTSSIIIYDLKEYYNELEATNEVAFYDEIKKEKAYDK